MSGDLLGELRSAAADPRELDRLLLDRSLQNADAVLREAVYAAAVPHWIDVGGLATLTTASLEEAQETYNLMAALPFVESHGEFGLNVHERTRAIILERLWEQDRPHFIRTSVLASRNCASHDLNEPLWIIEFIYHSLVVQPDLAIDMMHDVGWKFRSPPVFQYGHVESLAKVAREHVAAGRLSGRGAEWTAFWEAAVHFDYARYDMASGAISGVLHDTSGDLRLAAERAAMLADINLVLAERDIARCGYTDALTHYRTLGDRSGEMNCLLGLASTYGKQDEWMTAQPYLEAAYKLALKLQDHYAEAQCLLGLGDVHRLRGDLNEAKELYDRAMPLYRANDSILGRGLCLLRFGYLEETYQNWNQAQSMFEEALDMFRTAGSYVAEANCLFSIGTFHTRRGLWTAAADYFIAAKAVYHRIGSTRREAKCDEQLSQLHMPPQNTLSGRGVTDTASFTETHETVIAHGHTDSLTDVIAVVDDDDAVRESLAFVLTVTGHKVAAYASAADFLEQCDLAKVAGLILAHHMPKQTGLDLLAQLRKDGWTLPVLLVTGSPSPEILARASALGVDRVLERPLSDEGLMEFVGRVAA